MLYFQANPVSSPSCPLLVLSNRQNCTSAAPVRSAGAAPAWAQNGSSMTTNESVRTVPSQVAVRPGPTKKFQFVL